MAKKDEFDFDFGDDFDFDDSSNGGRPKKKNTFFRDLASGIGIGALEKMGNYMPPVQETAESVGEMASQMRDQFQAVRMQAQKIGSYAKGVSDDVKVVIGEIKNAKSLKDKISALDTGISRSKKNLAYKIDPEAAESFDFDKMFGDDEDSDTGASSTPTPGSTNARSDDSFIKERNEMFGLTGPGSMGGMEPVSGSGYGGSKGKKRSNGMVINVPSGGVDDKEYAALRETIITSAARTISNQNRLFKQQYIIDTKRHLQKMHALQQIADVATIQAKFTAEILGPSIKQSLDYLNKFTAQFTDMIDLQKSDDSSTGWDPIRKALSKKSQYSKKNMLDFTTSSGGVNVGELYGHASKQAKEMGDMYGLDMIKDMGSTISMMLMGGGGFNSIQSLGKSIGGLAMMPFKKQFTKIGQKISQNVAPTMMKGYEKMKESDNPVLNQIAEFLNIDTGTKNGVDLSTQNRRVPFDMVARRSIVEVIPSILSDIHVALTGEDKKIFDHSTGQFTTEKQMTKRIQSEIDSAGMGSMYGSKKALMKGAGENVPKGYEAALDTILKNIVLSGETFDSKKATDPEYIKKITSGVKGDSTKMVSAFLKGWDNIDNGDKSNFHVETQRARNSRTRELTDRELKYKEYGLGTAVGTTQNAERIAELQRKRHDMKKFNLDDKMRGTATYDKFMRENLDIDTEIARLQMNTPTATTTSMSGVKGVAGAVSQSPMQRIYDLLLEGIYVFPQGHNSHPPHLKKFKLQRKEENENIERMRESLEKQQEKYEELQRTNEEEKAKLVTDKLEEDRKNIFEKTFGRLPKPIQDMLSNSWIGKKIAAAKKKAKDSKIIKKLAAAKAATHSALDNASDYIDKVTSGEGGFVGGAVAQDVKNLSGKALAKFKKTDVYKKAVAIGLGAKEILDMARTKEGQEELKELVKTESDSLKQKLQDKMGDIGLNGKQVSDKVANSKVMQTFLKSKVGKKAIEVIGDVNTVMQMAQTKEGRSNIAEIIKTNSDKLKDKIQDKIGAAGDKIKETTDKIPEFVQKAKDSGALPGKEAAALMEELSSGKLSPFGMFKVHMKLLGLKLNTALFGAKEDGTETKKGIIGRVFETGKDLMKGVVDFLIGKDKEGKRYGLLYKVFSPTMKFFEVFRHQFMSRIALPFKAIAKATGKSIKWLIRDVKSNISHIGKGLMEKFRSGLDKLRNRKPGKGGLLDKAFGVAGVLTGAATKVVGGVMNFGFNRAKSKMEKLVAQGKISPEEYDEWIKENDTDKSEEKKRHDARMTQIESYKNSLINKDMTKKLAEGTDEISGLEAKSKNMTYEEEKQDRIRAKIQEKKNKKKLKKGEKLTLEEQYGALTTGQLAERKRDDLYRAAEKEWKKQQEEAQKKEREIQEQQAENTADIKGNVEVIRDVLTGAKRKRDFKKKYIQDAQADESGEGKPAEAAGEPKFVDKSTGYTEGTLEDNREDNREKQRDKTFEMLNNVLPALVVGIETTAKHTKNVDENTDELEKYAKKGPKEVILNSLNKLKNILLGVLTVGGGAANMAAAAAPFAAVGKQVGNTVTRFKEDGAIGALGEVTGLDSAGDSDFRADGTRKNALERAGDDFKAIKYGVRGGYKKSIDRFKKGATMVGNGLERIPGGKLLKQRATKVASIGSKILAGVTKGIKMILNLKTIKKFLKPDQIAKITKEIGEAIAKKAGVQAAKNGAKSVLGFLSGGIALALFAAADFASGMANAKRYFKVPPGAEIPLGMRIAAGVATALSGLAMGLIPQEWLARTIYDIVASPEDKKALQAMQDKQSERAKELGIEPDKLNELENTTWGQNLLDALPGGKKRKRNREAKLLGMTDEKYEEFMKKKEALDKITSTDEVKRAAENKMGGAGITVSGGTSEQKQTGLLNGFAAASIPGSPPQGSNDTINVETLEVMANRGVVPRWILDQAKLVVSGDMKDLSFEARDWLRMNGLGTKIEVTKEEKEIEKLNDESSAPSMAQKISEALKKGIKMTPYYKIMAKLGKGLKSLKGQKPTDIIGGIIGTIGSGVMNTVDTIGDFFGKIPGALGTAVGKTGKFLFKTIPKVAGKIKDTLGNFISKIPDTIGTAIGAVGNFISKTLPEVGGKIIAGIGETISKIPDVFFSVVGKIGDFVSKIPGFIGGALKSAIEGIKGAIGAAIRGIFGFFGDIGKSTEKTYNEKRKPKEKKKNRLFEGFHRFTEGMSAAFNDGEEPVSTSVSVPVPTSTPTPFSEPEPVSIAMPTTTSVPIPESVAPATSKPVQKPAPEPLKPANIVNVEQKPEIQTPKNDPIAKAQESLLETVEPVPVEETEELPVSASTTSSRKSSISAYAELERMQKEETAKRNGYNSYEEYNAEMLRSMQEYDKKKQTDPTKMADAINPKENRKRAGLLPHELWADEIMQNNKWIPKENRQLLVNFGTFLQSSSHNPMQWIRNNLSNNLNKLPKKQARLWKKVFGTTATGKHGEFSDWLYQSKRNEMFSQIVNLAKSGNKNIDPTKMADAFSDVFSSALNSGLSSLTGGKMGDDGSGTTTTTSYTPSYGLPSDFQPDDLTKDIKNPATAAEYFTKNAAGGLNSYLEQQLNAGNYDLFENLANKVEDPAHKGQLRNIESLAEPFKTRVKAFLNDPRLAGKNVTIREGRRTPLTQLAYFTKGRTDNVPFIDRMFRKAGFSGGAWDPKLKNTWTIGSKHFTGNAIDIEDHQKGEAFYRSIAPIAKEYGLEWGGDWGAGNQDLPHFEMPRSGMPGVASTVATTNSKKEALHGADAINPKEQINFTNDSRVDYMRNQTKQVEEALELQSVTKALETIHGDMLQVIGILDKTYKLHENNYSESSPMREYYKHQNRSQNSTQSAAGNAFNKYTGGSSSDKGFNVDMSTAAT
jgi:hypothetical protein